MFRCRVVRYVCEDEEWSYGDDGIRIVHGVHWDLEKVDREPAGRLDILYTKLDRLWCKPQGEIERSDRFDERDSEAGGVDERRASMTPRAVLRLSS